MPDVRVITCDNCGYTFESEWTDEEAAAEARRLWGHVPPLEDRAVVCDDCFDALMSNFN